MTLNKNFFCFFFPICFISLVKNMSALIKSALANQQSSCFQLRSALFHSTPVLERGRRNYWNSRYNNGNNNRRSRRNPFRQNILRDINDYAEYLIQNWQSGFDHEEEPSNKGPSWFRRPDSGSRRSWTNDQRRQNMRRNKDCMIARFLSRRIQFLRWWWWWWGLISISIWRSIFLLVICSSRLS